MWIHGPHLDASTVDELHLPSETNLSTCACTLSISLFKRSLQQFFPLRSSLLPTVGSCAPIANI